MNILITSAGRRAYVINYFKKYIGEGKVFASNSDYSIALQVADGYFISPLIYDHNYVNSLINFCKKNNIKAIISLFDIDLLVLSKAKKEIEKVGIKLLISDYSIIEVCNDKWKTFLWLQENKFNTPKTFKSIIEVKKAIKNNELKFPIIIKPRWGMASIGVYVTNDINELEVLNKKCIREISKSYLKFESAITPKETVIYQEVLSGQEYGIDIFNDLNGNFIECVSKQKLEMRAGETYLGKVVNNHPFMKLSKRLSSLLKHEIIMSVDCFFDKNKISIIEMNCRISGHYPIAHTAGVNLPKQIIEWLNGEDTDIKNFKFKKNILVTKDIVPIELEIN